MILKSLISSNRIKEYHLNLILTGQQYYIKMTAGNVREWTIRISGKKSDLFFDSSGQVKTFNNTDTSHILEKNDNYRSDVFRKNIQDFIDSIRTRKEPVVNSLDGMADIAMNLAVIESARTGHSVTMIIDHFGKEEDEWWLKY